MMTLAQFKKENNVPTIDFLQKDGRAFASVGTKSLVVSKDFKAEEPAFVIPLSKFNNGVDATDGSTIIDNAFVLINSAIKVVFSL